MPTYDYICQYCGNELELFQSMSEAPKRKCPKCGKLKLQRQIGMGAGVIFKGSGFYETDYRSDSYQKGAKEEKETKTSKAESTASDKSPASDKSTASGKKGSPKKTKGGDSSKAD